MRLIIHGSPENFIVAVRAATWLINAGPERRDGVVAYGDGPVTLNFYVKRNGSGSITVREIKRA